MPAESRTTVVLLPIVGSTAVTDYTYYKHPNYTHMRHKYIQLTNVLRFYTRLLGNIFGTEL
jgi:hypothetical protein